jgi:hypothetical protein
MPDDNGPRPGPGEHRIWAAYDELLRRCLVLEEIAERLAATAADPVAVADWWTWKAGA